MNDLPVIKLTALTKHFGKDLLNDSSRCAELLADFCSEYRLEVNLIVAALNEGCAAELLMSATDHIVLYEEYSQLVNRLCRNAGLVTEYADWAVNGVAKALNLQIASPSRKGTLASSNINITFHKLAQYAPRKTNVTNPISHIEPNRNCKAYEDAVVLAVSCAVTGTVDEKMFIKIGDFLEANDLDPISHFCDVIVEGFMLVANKMIEEGAVTAEDEHNLCLFLEQTADFFLSRNMQNICLLVKN